ncbi:pentatricopeptide repeat-containing protein At5g01110 [Rhizophagus clarus]|uniref:Pentatricopeptide repeat-containing protein At5g01110 n=1 Tax=Rhizophagus clarus TaxID=94130 RepID=A0A8H3LPK1_9GLOM|nr:pentatricopeptide repeat-containing protein At5g01110 [Rhizophagus clarus]
MISFSYILVKGFVKTFPPKFYNTQGSLYTIKKKNSLITKTLRNITTNNNNNKTELLRQQQIRQLNKHKEELLELKLINIQKNIEKAIIKDKKKDIIKLYIESKILYRDYEVKSVKGVKNFLIYLIKKDKLETAISLLKYIDKKEKLIMDLVYVFIELFEDFEKDENKFNQNYKISQYFWYKINNNNILDDKLLEDLIKIFNSMIGGQIGGQNPRLIKPLLQGMLSSGIKNEKLYLNVLKHLAISQLYQNDNNNEEILIEIYNIFKENGIKFNDNDYKDLLMIQQKKKNINNLTFFYNDMISSYAKEELDQIGITSLQLIQDSFKEGKTEIAIKHFFEISTKKIKSNPIILFELFKGLFETKVENFKIFLIFKTIRNEIQINSDIGYYLTVGFLWNDGLYYAERILQEMMESKIIPPTYTYIPLINSYWDNEMTNKIEELMGLIKPIYIREYLSFLRGLLVYYNKKQDKKGILRWINELVKYSDEDYEELKDYGILMHSFGVLGRLSNVLEIWHYINEKYSGEPLSPAISVLLDQIGICGDIITLKKYWKLFTNNSDRKYIINLNHYNSYIEALCRFKAFDDAIKVFKFDIALNGFEPTLKTFITLLQPLINGLICIMN